MSTTHFLTKRPILASGALLLALSGFALVAFHASEARAGAPALPVFTTPLAIDNAFFPFEVGAVQSFRGKSDGARTAVVDDFSATTRTFAWNSTTVDARMLREVEFEDGQLSEISYNYFAQADDGAVYYFGEVVDIYEDDVIVAHDGSWLVGGPTDPGDPPTTANAPNPNVFMPANPQIGDQFKPEDLAPIVDETVTVLQTGKKCKVEAGKFADVLIVKETSVLPDSDPEIKWYAAGVGVVRTKAKGEKLGLIASTYVQD